jgi:hypothetical protein
MVGPRVVVSRETWTGGMIQCREAGVGNLLLVWWVTRPSAIFPARFETNTKRYQRNGHHCQGHAAAGVRNMRTDEPAPCQRWILPLPEPEWFAEGAMEWGGSVFPCPTRFDSESGT